jgi:hypothetical protein
MSKPFTPSFQFHIPHSGKLITYPELEKIVNKGKRVPDVVHIVDCDTHRVLQSIPPKDALQKFG